jgi:hypothetical protein
MAKYIFFMRGGDAEARDYAPEEYQQLLQRYFEWSEHLRSNGHFLSAEQLKTNGRVVQRGSIVVDGPFAETKEAIGGFYLIEAKDYDEATQLAQGCPVLTHGGFVEVREIVDYGE